MPQMGVDTEKLKAPKPPDAGWYQLRLIGFKPQKNKKADSYNLNGQFEIVNKQDGRFDKVYDTMSLKMPSTIAAIVHGLGQELTPEGNIPGDFDPDPSDPENTEKWQYKGPLLGKIMEAELAITKYGNNPERASIKQVRCKLGTVCPTKYPEMRHPTNMIGTGK